MIEIAHLTKGFGAKLVIHDLNLSLEDGRFTTLMGASGCGKTTFAHLLLGLIHPDSGTIQGLEGKHLAAVFQEDRLCEQLSSLQNIKLTQKHRMEDSELLLELKLVGLDAESAKKPVGQLSGGQKRRVAILRAVLADSDFLCFDEPFKGLDRNTKHRTMTYVKNKTEGKTVLLITHESSEAQFFGGEQIFL